MDSLYEFLREKLSGVTKLAVLGAGSTLRADDAAGIFVIEKMQELCAPKKYPDVLFCAGETAPENFSGKIKNFCPTHLLIVDAANLGKAPGTLVDINPNDVGGPSFCSHMLPLKVMINYIVDGTSTVVTLLGIQYKSLEFDGAMTSEVSEAVDIICNTLKCVIDELFSKE